MRDIKYTRIFYGRINFGAHSLNGRCTPFKLKNQNSLMTFDEINPPKKLMT